MNSIKKLLALLTLAVITLLITGCATSKYDTGISSYEKMVEKFSLQDLDLSAPEFQSLKKNMICYFDDTAFGDGSLVTICYSENEKVNFVFSTRMSKNPISDTNGYVSTRKDNGYQSGENSSFCKNLKREKFGLISECRQEVTSTKRVLSKSFSYIFRARENLIIFSEKGNKEENDPTSLLPKIKEVLIKVK